MSEPGPWPPLDRRHFLAGLAGTGAALLAGCTATSASPSVASATAAATPSTAGSSPAPAPSAASSPTAGAVHLPATSPWQPTASEISPAVKVRAVRLLEALGTWSSASSDPAALPGLAAARARVARLGYDPALAEAATVLLGGTGSAAVQVVDAQYGGILSSSSSVLVVLKQWRTGAGGTTVVAGGTTVDVRLVAASPRWRVTALHPAAPSPPGSGLSVAASALLASPRLHLPVAARADLRSGTISAGVLGALRGLAARHVVDVSVVKSGHPLYVFGTNRLSDHPRGHAVDVWAVDGRPVVDPANRALVESVMRLGIALGAYQVGGPVDLDGGGSQYFSDNTHHDHVHMGFHI
jgi:hypothetical protein